MPRWRVDLIGKVLFTLGAGEAPTERSAVAQAAKEFHVPPARVNRIKVTRIDDGNPPKKKAPPKQG